MKECGWSALPDHLHWLAGQRRAGPCARRRASRGPAARRNRRPPRSRCPWRRPPGPASSAVRTPRLPPCASRGLSSVMMPFRRAVGVQAFREDDDGARLARRGQHRLLGGREFPCPAPRRCTASRGCSGKRPRRRRRPRRAGRVRHVDRHSFDQRVGGAAAGPRQDAHPVARRGQLLGDRPAHRAGPGDDIESGRLVPAGFRTGTFRSPFQLMRAVLSNSGCDAAAGKSRAVLTFVDSALHCGMLDSCQRTGLRARQTPAFSRPADGPGGGAAPHPARAGPGPDGCRHHPAGPGASGAARGRRAVPPRRGPGSRRRLLGGLPLRGEPRGAADPAADRCLQRAGR